MRVIALISQPQSEEKRLMIHATGGGVYLFGYDTIEDAPCLWDEWYETVADAKVACEQYGVTEAAWQSIPDPLEGGQQDWIAPVRVKGRAEGNPQWGVLEQLVDNQWLPL